MAKKKGAGTPSRAVSAAKPKRASSAGGMCVVFTRACSSVVVAAVWVNMRVVGTIGGVLTVLSFVWTKAWETVVGTAVPDEEAVVEEEARPHAPSGRTLTRRRNRKIAAAAAAAARVSAVESAEEAAAAASETAALEAAAAAEAEVAAEEETTAEAEVEAEADEEASSQSSWGVSASTASVWQAGGATTPPPPPGRFAGRSAPASLLECAESSEDEEAEAPLPKKARLSASVCVSIPETLAAGKVKAVYQKRDGQRVASVLGLVLSDRCEVVAVTKGSLFGDAGVCKGMTVWGAACEGGDAAPSAAVATPSQLAAFVQRVAAGGGGAATLQAYLSLDVACLDTAAKASTALTEPGGGDACLTVLPGRVVPQWGDHAAACVVETQRPLLLVASCGAYTLHAGVFAADTTVAAAAAAAPQQQSTSGPLPAVRAGHRVRVAIRSESGLAVRAQSAAPLPLEHGCCTLTAVCADEAAADESESEEEEEEEEEEKDSCVSVGSRRQLHGTSIRQMSTVEKALLRTRFTDLSVRGRDSYYRRSDEEDGPQLLDAWQLHNPNLEARFRASRESSHGSTVVQECFHGTSESNILSILRSGFDVGRRCGQAYGPGEYFGTYPDVSVGYCNNGAFMLVCKVLLRGGDVYNARDGVLVVDQTSEVLCLPQYLVQFYNPPSSRYCEYEHVPDAATHFNDYLEQLRHSELHQQLSRLADPRATALPCPAPVPGAVGPPPQPRAAALPPKPAYREWEGCANAVVGVGRLGAVRRSACGTHAVMETDGRETAAATTSERACDDDHSSPCTQLWLGYFRVAAKAGDEAEVSALLAEELERLFAAVAPGGVPAAARMGGSRSGDYVVLPRAVAVDAAAEAPAAARGAGRARAVEASPVAFVQEDVAGEQVAEALVRLSRGVQPEELLMVNALLAGGKVHAQKGRRAVLASASAHGRLRLVDARHGAEEVKAALGRRLLGQGPPRRLPRKERERAREAREREAAAFPYRYVRHARPVSEAERHAELTSVCRTLHLPEVLAKVPVRDEFDSVFGCLSRTVDAAYKLDVPRWRAAYYARTRRTKPAAAACTRDFGGEHDVWVACPADINPRQLQAGGCAAVSLRRKPVWPSARAGWAGTGVYFTTDAKAAAARGSRCVLRCRVNLSSDVAVRGDIRDGRHWSICAKSYQDFVPLYVVFLHEA